MDEENAESIIKESGFGSNLYENLGVMNFKAIENEIDRHYNDLNWYIQKVKDAKSTDEKIEMMSEGFMFFGAVLVDLCKYISYFNRGEVERRICLSNNHRVLNMKMDSLMEKMHELMSAPSKTFAIIKKGDENDSLGEQGRRSEDDIH